MGPLRDAGWILLGLGLGSGFSLMLGRHVVALPAVDVASLSSLVVFAMLAGSLREPWSRLADPR